MADEFVNQVSEVTNGNEFATELAEEMSEDVGEAVVAGVEDTVRNQFDNWRNNLSPEEQEAYEEAQQAIADFNFTALEGFKPLASIKAGFGQVGNLWKTEGGRKAAPAIALVGLAIADFFRFNWKYDD